MRVFGLKDLPGNMTKASGLCTSRPRPDGGYEEDIAYRMENSQSAMSLPTRLLFPRKFPSNYVIMTTVKTEMDNVGSLFSIFNADRQLSLAFSVNPIGLKYRKPDGSIGKVTFGASLADGQWHRIALSIGERVIVMVVDCEEQVPSESVVDKPSDFPVSINTSGITVLGSDFKDGSYFRVSMHTVNCNISIQSTLS